MPPTPADAITTAQVASFLFQAGILLMGGVLGLLVRGASQRLAELAQAVADLRGELKDQGQKLAGGAQRFTDIERRLERVEEKVEAVQTRGCARVVACEE